MAGNTFLLDPITNMSQLEHLVIYARAEMKYIQLLQEWILMVQTERYLQEVQNTVGFTWHPETGEMWFTDNSRDMLGDNYPPCN